MKLSASLARQKAAGDKLDRLEASEAEERRVRLLLLRQELSARRRMERRRDIVLAVAVALMVSFLSQAPEGAVILVPAWLMLTGRLLVGSAGRVRWRGRKR